MIPTSNTKNLTNNPEGKTLNGASVLAFGPDHVLFVGDSRAGVIHAIPTEAKAVKDPVPFNTFAIDRKIAKKLKTTTEELIIQDMQIHPVSQEAYIAFKNGHAPEAKAMIAIVNPIDNSVRLLDIEKADKKQVSIKEPRTESFKFYRTYPVSSLNITDIDYYDGYVYVAGIDQW